MIQNIRQFGDPVLRQKSAEIAKIDKEIKELVKNMADTMYEANGMGLAAVQIGVLQKVIVTDISGEGEELKAIVNPTLIKKEGNQIEEEGCLSIHEIRVPVERAQYVKIKGIDLKTGEEIIIEADDWFARALQHELDHLDGKLIIDRTDEETRSKVLKELTLGNLEKGRFSQRTVPDPHKD